MARRDDKADDVVSVNMDSLVATCGMREGFSQNGGMRRSGVRGRRALCTLNTVQLHGRLVGVLPEWDPSGRASDVPVLGGRR